MSLDGAGADRLVPDAACAKRAPPVTNGMIKGASQGRGCSVVFSFCFFLGSRVPLPLAIQAAAAPVMGAVPGRFATRWAISPLITIWTAACYPLLSKFACRVTNGSFKGEICWFLGAA